MRFLTVMSLVTLLMLTRAIWADEAAPLTEAAAVKLALLGHPSVRAAQAESNMGQARVGVARAEALPQLSVNGLAAASSMPNVIAVPAVMPQALLQSQGRSSLDLNGMAMLPLYTAGRVQSAVRAAQSSAAALHDQQAFVRTQVAYAARERFAEWREALAMQTAAQEALTAQTGNAELVTQLFAAGKVPRFDQLRAQAAQAAAQQQLDNARAEVIAGRAQLAQALAVPAEQLPTSATEDTPAEPPANLLETALANRPDLLAARQAVTAAEATVRTRKAAYDPQLYAFGMADVLAPADMGRSVGTTVGLVAGIPVFTGGRRQAEVSEAEEAVAQARANRDALELQVRAEVAGTEARATAARRNIATAAAQVAAMEEAATVAQARYAASKSTIVELLDAQRTLTEARQNQIAAQARYRAALAAIYLAIGQE